MIDSGYNLKKEWTGLPSASNWGLKKIEKTRMTSRFWAKGVKLVNGVALYLNEEDFTGSRCEVRRAQQLKGLKSGDHLR